MYGGSPVDMRFFRPAAGVSVGFVKPREFVSFVLSQPTPTMT